jgi:hypothetical protein
MRPSLFLLPLVLAACAKQPGPRSEPGNAMTLCIENATAGYGNVVARVEAVRYEVTPGRSVCRTVTLASASPRLTAVTTGGGTTGPLRFAVNLPSSTGACWRWRLSGSQTEGALLPCREGEGL